MMIRKKRIPVGALNTLSSLLLQLFAIANGFIIPRLILQSYGSEVNGLVSSLSQFLNFVTLLEGGVNGVIMASLYKPLSKKDDKKISSIVYTSKLFFRKISYVLIIYTLIIAVAYPLLSNNSFSFGYISTLTLILSIKLFSQYCFSLSYQNLLTASKHGYIISFSKIALIILDVVAVFIITKLSLGIHILELSTSLIYLTQPIIFQIAVKRYFKLQKNIKVDNQLIKDRWNGLSINLAYFVHSNTDITILTIFTNLQTVSVYSVYALVGGGISKVINAATSAITPSIGNLYAEGNKQKLDEKFDIYEYFTMISSMIMFGLGILLITPFVMIYTNNITDTNYFQPLFGVVLIISEFLYVIRAPYVNLAYSAGKFKDISKHAYIEALLNIAISLILVHKLGLLGIAIGTASAMFYRTAFQIYYLKDHILNRPIKKFIKRFLLLFIPISLTVIMLSIFLPINSNSFWSFVAHALLYFLILIAMATAVSFLKFKTDLNNLRKYFSKK